MQVNHTCIRIIVTGLLPKSIYFAREVVTIIDINTVIAVITLVITAVGFGLQLASYINTKNDRPTSSKL